MFHKKFILKEQISVSKKEVRNLWETACGFVGESNIVCLETFWKRNDLVTRATWSFSTGGSAMLYLVNKVPLLIEVKCLPPDANGLGLHGLAIVAPTLFLLLLVRSYHKGDNTDFGSLFGTHVFCHGPTSRFILAGAHLMMPGIVERKVHAEKAVCKGDLAFIYSVGNLFPYAVGLTTEGFVNHDQRGKGVYVIHSYKDNLWNSFFDNLHEYFSLSVSIVPLTFRESEVSDVASVEMKPSTDRFSVEFDPDRGVDGAGAAVKDPCDDERTLKSALALLEIEDNLLDFALCETVRELNATMLPLPLGEFVPLLLGNYPRIPCVKMAVDFKSTSYKKALSYLAARDDVVTLSEERKGEYFITNVSKKCDLYRSHRRTYADFLDLFHYPLKDEERLLLERKVIQDGAKKGLKRRIKSVTTHYSPNKKEICSVQRYLCTGILDDSPALLGGELSPTGVNPQMANSDNDEYLDHLYPRKELCKRLRDYVSSKNILKSPEDCSSVPYVVLDVFLEHLVKDSVKELPITDLEAIAVQKLFVPVHEILLETTADVSGISSSVPVISQIVRRGNLPSIVIYTERRSGNKTVTIVKHVDNFGFEPVSLSNQWKHQFSTSCSVFDPSKQVPNNRVGKKAAVEIHLGGNWLVKLKKSLETDLGFPPHLIVDRGS